MPVRPKVLKPKKQKTDTHYTQPLTWGRGRGGRPWRRLRDSVLVRDNYLCQCEDCKRKGLITLADEVDHIIPLAFGGNDDVDNLRAINHKCHEKKTIKESISARSNRQD